jgi:hypothetical protein
MANKNNMVLSGKLKATPTETSEGKTLLQVTVKQKINEAEFEELTVPVIIDTEKWKKFQKDNPTFSITITGNLKTEKKLDENQKPFTEYSIVAEFISGYDDCLSEETGDNCIFNGFAKILKMRNFDENEHNCLFGRKVLFQTPSKSIFEVVAMRKVAKEFSQFEVGDSLHLIATLMPSRDKNVRFPYLSVKAITKESNVS